ncbi:MAG: thermonuclease family protein [Candidatus Paceibacterota bacterium]|jgi:micrococcal nuclease
MKRKLIFGFIVAFALITVQEAFFSKDAPASTWNSEVQVNRISTSTPALVTRVVDGDTIIALINGVSERVRLIGVDTPETVDPRKLVQCFSKEASAFTATLLQDKTVRLEFDPSQSNRDKYGRLLRYVFLTDGTLMDKLLITEGYGYEYTYDTPYKYQSEFKQAQASAKELKKGLWADGVCVKQ